MFQLLEVTGETSSALTGLLSGLDFSVLMDYYLEICGVAIPVIVGVLAVKKGISWLMGFIRRA